MSKKGVGPVFGVTTSTITVGLSAVIGFKPLDFVTQTYYRYQSGGTLFVGGWNGITLPTFANMVTTSVQVVSTAANQLVDGPAPYCFIAAGSTALVSVIQYLGEGYSGSPGNY